MTAYGQNGPSVNQLDNIISAINNRSTRSHAAYTMQIQYPGNETLRKMGGPCLNYLAVQIEKGRVGLLAAYRNHEFLERAYGNYLGLCNLIKFIAQETSMRPGMLTCISSHAFAAGNKRELKDIAAKIKTKLTARP
jgi:thymidylate synthase